MSVAKKYSRKARFLLFKLTNHAYISYKDKKTKAPDTISSKLNISYNMSNRTCRLDIFKPIQIEKTLPILVYFHGGGWAVGDKGEYRTFCKIMANKGFVVFNVNYTRTSKAAHPAPIKDCINAVEWVYEHAIKYGGDINNIFISGDSAGGHIAGLIGDLCTNEKMYKLYEKKYNIRISFKEELRGLGILCGVNDIRSCYNFHFPCIKEFAKMLLDTEYVLSSPIADELSIVKNMTEDFPPCFLTTTANDPLYSESVLLEKEMTEKNVSHKMLAFDENHKDLYHVYQVDQTLPEARECLSEMVSYFHNLMQ